jgi:hypothetical protein
MGTVQAIRDRAAEMFMASPMFKKAEAEAKAEAHAERVRWASELKAELAVAEKEGPRLNAVVEKAQAAVELAREALHAAELRRNEALVADWTASAVHTRRRNELERRLRDTAPGALKGFLVEVDRQLGRVRAGGPSWALMQNKWTDEQRTFSNYPEIVKLIEVIQLARQMAERRLSEPLDDVGAAELVAEIKAALPGVNWPAPTPDAA